MLPRLSARLLEEWEARFPGRSRPKTLHYLGIPGSVENGTSTFLGFPDGADEPAFAVKLRRLQASLDAAGAEAALLERIRASGGACAESVPRVVWSGGIEGTRVIVLSILEGTPMAAPMTTAGLPELGAASKNFAAVSGWLLRLSSALADKTHEARGNLEAAGKEDLDEFSEAFPLSPKERLYVDSIRRNMEALTFPGVFVQHGDLCRHNILVGPGDDGLKISVIDWSDGRQDGFALHDLFFFLSTYFVQCRKAHGLAGMIDSFNRTFLEPNPYSREVRNCLRGFHAGLGLPEELAGPLFGLFLARQSLQEKRKILRCSKEGGLPRIVIALAQERGLGFREALEDQLWLHYFRAYAARREEFVS